MKIYVILIVFVRIVIYKIHIPESMNVYLDLIFLLSIYFNEACLCETERR